MSKHALCIDYEACWGCQTCEVACSQEFDFKNKFLSVIEKGPTLGGDMRDYVYHVNLCKHCDDPPCAEACLEEAIYKRDDGIVILDYDKCTGCQSCIEECPYNAIGFDEDKQTVLKCNLCYHRVDKGLIPACADNVCLAHCIHFGDPEEIKAYIETNRKRRRTV
jgi:NADH-dependent fumarate reductase subunit E